MDGEAAGSVADIAKAGVAVWPVGVLQAERNIPKTKITNKGSPIGIFDLVMGNLVNVKYIDKGDNQEALQVIVVK